MKFENPWDPEDSDRLIWQTLTLAMDAVLSLRVVRGLLAINPFADAVEATPATKPKRKRRESA
jgi:hypothetical protein